VVKGRPEKVASSPKSASVSLRSRVRAGTMASPAAVRRTPRPARSSNFTPICPSSRRICWLIAEEVR
jgi:hypothetical protein